MMKKSFIFGAALMLVSAFAFQSCSNEDNGGKPLEPTVAVIDNGMDMKDVVAKFVNANNEVILPAGVELTMNEAITLEKPLYIVGNKEKPAKIIAAAGFVTNSSITFEGVEIDAAEVKTPFIQLATTELQEDEKAKKIDLIAFIDSEIFDLKYQFIYGNKQPYLVDCINVQKSIIAYNGSNKKTTFDFNGGGNVTFLGVSESTIYSIPTVNNNGGFFSSQSSKDVTELGGETQTFVINNSTLYNITNGKTVNSLRKNSQTYQKYSIKDNIIVNSGKNGQFLAGLNAGQKGKAENWEVSGNLINFGGEDVSATELTKITAESISPIEGKVEFADAANGDFTQSQAAAGDPRWIANAQ